MMNTNIRRPAGGIGNTFHRSSAPIPEQNIASIYKDLKKNFIGFPRSFLALTGNNHKAAILLNQIIYWCSKHNKPVYFQQQAAWEHQIGLSLKEVQRALRILKDKKLITTSCHRVKSIVTTFYEPSWSMIQSQVFEIEEGMRDESEMDKLVIPEKDNSAISRKDRFVIPKNPKREVLEQDKREVSMERTKGHNLYYSSEEKYSNGYSLVKKYNMRNAALGDVSFNSPNGDSDFITSKNRAVYHERLKDGRGMEMHPTGFPLSWDEDNSLNE